jgi:hypothetical protein
MPCTEKVLSKSTPATSVREGERGARERQVASRHVLLRLSAAVESRRVSSHSLVMKRDVETKGANLSTAQIFGEGKAPKSLFHAQDVTAAELVDAICIHLVGMPRVQCKWWSHFELPRGQPKGGQPKSKRKSKQKRSQEPRAAADTEVPARTSSVSRQLQEVWPDVMKAQKSATTFDVNITLRQAGW